MLKPKPWEIFCAVLKWKMTLELVTGASGSVGSRDRLSQAIRAAERETALHLRHDLQWSLINSHLMAARLAAAAEKWIRSGTGDPDELRSWLRAAWCARWSVHLQEEQRCRETEHALAGGSRGGAGAESMNSPAEAGEHVFELYI